MTPHVGDDVETVTARPVGPLPVQGPPSAQRGQPGQGWCGPRGAGELFGSVPDSDASGATTVQRSPAQDGHWLRFVAGTACCRHIVQPHRIGTNLKGNLKRIGTNLKGNLKRIGTNIGDTLLHTKRRK